MPRIQLSDWSNTKFEVEVENIEMLWNDSCGCIVKEYGKQQVHVRENLPAISYKIGRALEIEKKRRRKNGNTI